MGIWHHILLRYACDSQRHISLTLSYHVTNRDTFIGRAVGLDMGISEYSVKQYLQSILVVSSSERVDSTTLHANHPKSLKL